MGSNFKGTVQHFSAISVNVTLDSVSSAQRLETESQAQSEIPLFVPQTGKSLHDGSQRTDLLAAARSCNEIHLTTPPKAQV